MKRRRCLNLLGVVLLCAGPGHGPREYAEIPFDSVNFLKMPPGLYMAWSDSGLPV